MYNGLFAFRVRLIHLALILEGSQNLSCQLANPIPEVGADHKQTVQVFSH